MIKFDGERFAIMSRDGDWRELNGTYSIAVENDIFTKDAETTIILKMPNNVFEKALYARGFIGKAKYEPFYADNKLIEIAPYYSYKVPTVFRTIINPPATIVIWADGTKTVCKCADGDTFDPEKGIAMCFMKKMFGNPSQVRKFMKSCIKEDE